MAEPFGRYTLLDRFAVSSSAELFRAQQVGDARIVVVKRLTEYAMQDDHFVVLLRDELWVARLLRHRNIAAIYDEGREGGRDYVACEYVSGLALDTVARKRTSPFPLAFAAFIAQQVAEALTYAHALRDRENNPLLILHRKVSPDNVLLSWSGDVKVTNFAVAKASDRSGRGAVLKTSSRYLSPEQIRGQPLDGRSDQFALGTVLWEACTGTQAFEAESEFDLLQKLRDADIARCSAVNPAIRPRLEGVIHRMLAREPHDRFATAAEVSTALADVLTKDFRPAGPDELAAWLRATFPAEYESERELLASYAPEQPAPPEPSHEPLLEQMIAAFAKHKQSG